MGEPQIVDYEAVLADLRAKRDRLDAAIAGIEMMLGMRNLDSQAGAEPKRTQKAGSALGPGAFLGMTIVEATAKYLAHVRQNQRTEEIADALKSGGIVLNAEKPLNVVGSVLNRNFSNGGEIVRVSRGVWGLASWHPRLRKRKNGSVVETEDDELPTPEASDGDVETEDPSSLG